MAQLEDKHWNYTSQGKQISKPRKPMQTIGKSLLGQAQTFSDGGTLQRENFRSKKPTTCRGTIKIKLRRVSGERSGILHSGPKCPSSSGSQFKTAFLPGTISKRGVS
jgi:hypothetical protein